MSEQIRKFTPDEIETARTADLLSLLESLGYSVIRVGSYYSVKEMDILRIKNRRTWFRYSEQVGGDEFKSLTDKQVKRYMDYYSKGMENVRNTMHNHRLRPLA